MTTNTGDNFDPSYPYGVDFRSIWVEEEYCERCDKKTIDWWCDECWDGLSECCTAEIRNWLCSDCKEHCE